ncbi:hypothetical protein HanRHA438_Chr13g0603781 [Helianthus annuus]|nr:hypothetical protein HanPSC8_Chr13g0571191 [Helianthus annuus]KAJ0858678.1 hypothetical protein HanRHA438_Chr13g0603781 [Helianthus annuus]
MLLPNKVEQPTRPENCLFHHLLKKNTRKATLQLPWFTRILFSTLSFRPTHVSIYLYSFPHTHVCHHLSTPTRPNMSGEAVRKAWVVAASIGSIEALKDQGVARWNGPLMELQQHAKTMLMCSCLNASVDLSSLSFFAGAKHYSCSPVVTVVAGEDSVKRRYEESMNKVMDVSCFGPNTVRF